MLFLLISLRLMSFFHCDIFTVLKKADSSTTLGPQEPFFGFTLLRLENALFLTQFSFATSLDLHNIYPDY